MRIIIDNLKKDKSKTYKITCENCDSELEITKEDVEGYKYLGLSYITCPVCGKHTFTNIEELDKTITIDCLEYPNDFYNFKNGVDTSSVEIMRWIKQGIKYFRENPRDFCYTTGSGNTYVAVYNYSGDEEYRVVVAKGYYEAEIPFAKEDIAAQDSVDWKWRNRGAVFWEDKRKRYENEMAEYKA